MFKIKFKLLKGFLKCLSALFVFLFMLVSRLAQKPFCKETWFKIQQLFITIPCSDRYNWRIFFNLLAVLSYMYFCMPKTYKNAFFVVKGCIENVSLFGNIQKTFELCTLNILIKQSKICFGNNLHFITQPFILFTPERKAQNIYIYSKYGAVGRRVRATGWWWVLY